MRSDALVSAPESHQKDRTHSSLYRLTPQELDRNHRIEEYLPLVGKVIEKFRKTLPSHVNLDDLHGVGVMGLVAAAERFIPEQANTFPSYAYIRIRGAIFDELRRLDPCSRRSRQAAKKIETAREEVAQTLGRAPSDKDVSEHLQVSLTEFDRLRETASPVRIVSLDVPLETDSSGSSSFHEVIPDVEQLCVRETMQQEDLKKLLTKRLSELPEIQKKVLALYYFEGMRFAEIALAFDLTESRICQLHRQAVSKLQALMRSETGC